MEQGGIHAPDTSDPIMELFEDAPRLKGPPEATLARRAKSYSNFYEVAVNYLNEEAKAEKPKDVLDLFDSKVEGIPSRLCFEDLEDDLLDASQEEFQYVLSLHRVACRLIFEVDSIETN
jgi:hypothetical protein